MLFVCVHERNEKCTDFKIVPFYRDQPKLVLKIEVDPICVNNTSKKKGNWPEMVHVFFTKSCLLSIYDNEKVEISESASSSWKFSHIIISKSLMDFHLKS